MHFKIKKRKPVGWSLRVCRGVGKGRYDEYVPHGSWPAGLRADMSLEGARNYVRSLNAKLHILESEASKTGAQARLRSEAEKACAWLPPDVVAHFESIHIEARRDTPTYDKLCSLWKLCRKAIQTVNGDPLDWALEPRPIYEFFTRLSNSADYVRRAISMLNAYGLLFCRKRGQGFSPIPGLPEPWLSRIKDRFDEEGDGKKSLPLGKTHFRALLSNLEPEQYRWVVIAWSFGLRPNEVDLVLGPRLDGRGRVNWAVEGAGKVLVCDQPKLRDVRRRERLKRIPIFLPEQTQAIALILGHESKAITCKRPSRRAVERAFPEGVTLYGCRHGFAQHMERVGQPMASVSKWLGHRSMATTEKYYRDHSLLALPDDEAA